MQQLKKLLPMISAVLLSACGGGGSDSPGTATTTGPSAEGVYGGTLTGSTSTAFNLLVLENGDYWSIYGAQTSTAFNVAGFVQGTGASNNGSFTSSNAKDFGFAPAVAGTITATYDATAKTISGSTVEGASTAKFTGGPVQGSLYNYNTPASLTALTGTWSVTSLTGEGIALNVAASGAFTAVSSLGCSFTGAATPRSSGKNVFNVSITFGAAPCVLAGQSATGVAITYPLPNGKAQLIVSAVDSARSFGTAAFGIR